MISLICCCFLLSCLSIPVWSGKAVLQASRRCYAGVTWNMPSPPIRELPSLSPAPRTVFGVFLEGSPLHFLQGLTKKESWEANFWDLSCLSENSLTLLLYVADNPASPRIPDWGLFSLKFGGKALFLLHCTTAVEKSDAWTFVCDLLFLSVKTCSKNICYSQTLSNMFWNWSFVIYCT